MCLKFTPSVEINLTLKDRPKQDSRYVIILWTEGVNWIGIRRSGGVPDVSIGSIYVLRPAEINIQNVLKY